MIITKLVGGLGNQMFQYAAGKALAEQHHTRLLMDTSWFKEAVDIDTPREYELDCFALTQDFSLPGTFALIEDATPTIKSRLYNLTKGRIKPRVVHHREIGHSFNKDFFRLPDNTYLEGWWQTEKYFSHIRKGILKDFSFVSATNAKNQKLAKQIKGTNAVSLHVRRGDYLTAPSAKTHHGLMGLDYYKKAVELITKKVKDPHFFVFSDDPKWCQANLKTGFPTTYVTHNKSGQDDMHLMINCQHHIIANSTFSWWGAWLNPSTKKLVYAPKRWLLEKSVDTSDILPKEWIKL